MPNQIILENHEYADIFPLIQGDDFDRLASDIESNGQHEPITMYQGKILDGRNRYRACIELGIPFKQVEYTGDDPLGLVLSLNLHRRHLTPSQRAAIAVEALPHYEAEAKKRQIRKPADSVVAKLPQQKSRDQAAQDIGASPRYVSEAKKIKAESPADFEKLKSGEVTIQEVKNAHVSNNSGENEWYTPIEFIETADAVMLGIDLDPASSAKANESVNAISYYTKDDDGLSKEWKGRIWMNPPYAQPLISQFIEKLCTSERVTEYVCLVNNATETSWFQMIATRSTAICFINKRVRFLDPDGNKGAPLQGQAALYFGDNVDSFIDLFSFHGFVVEMCHV